MSATSGVCFSKDLNFTETQSRIVPSSSQFANEEVSAGRVDWNQKWRGLWHGYIVRDHRIFNEAMVGVAVFSQINVDALQTPRTAVCSVLQADRAHTYRVAQVNSPPCIVNSFRDCDTRNKRVTGKRV